MISGSRFLPAFAAGLVCAVMLTAAGSLIADAAEATPVPEWSVEQLMQGLAQVKTAKGKFVERKYLTILTAPLEFSGTLVYTAPAHLEKYTLLPEPQSMVLDRDRLTMENKAKNERRTVALQDYPVIWAFVESMRSTLAGDLPTLTRFYRVDLEGTENQWRLLLKPSEPKMQAMVSEIRIGGARNRIRTIEIVEAEGNRSVMAITEDAP
jgi:hypothetical protein